ncbi:MAG: hypothetical protein P4N60_20435 [Verrucomicrobiae bacterium]|nr:hypothetical protein [Verrucomicrobiae bacterium]
MPLAEPGKTEPLLTVKVPSTSPKAATPLGPGTQRLCVVRDTITVPPSTLKVAASPTLNPTIRYELPACVFACSRIPPGPTLTTVPAAPLTFRPRFAVCSTSPPLFIIKVPPATPAGAPTAAGLLDPIATVTLLPITFVFPAATVIKPEAELAVIVTGVLLVRVYPDAAKLMLVMLMAPPTLIPYTPSAPPKKAVSAAVQPALAAGTVPSLQTVGVVVVHVPLPGLFVLLPLPTQNLLPARTKLGTLNMVMITMTPLMVLNSFWTRKSKEFEFCSLIGFILNNNSFVGLANQEYGVRSFNLRILSIRIKI